MKKKRVVVIADKHCGHLVGLTPPEYQKPFESKWGYIQYQLWNAYVKAIELLKPIDVLLVNGDNIEGKGPRSGSTELVTSDRNTQTEMAARCILEAEADEIVMTYGTPYHVGAKEDWEKQVADKVKAKKIGGQEWVDVNGVIFDLKHHVGSSTIPHGTFTPVAKENLWNSIWAYHNEQPKSHIIIRSHVHNFGYCGEESWLGITTPALQGLGTKFGARICSRHVDFGLIYFDVPEYGMERGMIPWGWNIVRVESQKAKVIKL